jgi:hypothetical protein
MRIFGKGEKGRLKSVVGLKCREIGTEVLVTAAAAERKAMTMLTRSEGGSRTQAADVRLPRFRDRDP